MHHQGALAIVEEDRFTDVERIDGVQINTGRNEEIARLNLDFTDVITGSEEPQPIGRARTAGSAAAPATATPGGAASHIYAWNNGSRPVLTTSATTATATAGATAVLQLNVGKWNGAHTFQALPEGVRINMEEPGVHLHGFRVFYGKDHSIILNRIDEITRNGARLVCRFRNRIQDVRETDVVQAGSDFHGDGGADINRFGRQRRNRQARGGINRSGCTGGRR